jgi:hypothetical protein
VFPPVREKLISILGDLEIDELFNFVVEHVQQHASPQTIVEGLEPVSFTAFHRYRRDSDIARLPRLGSRRRSRATGGTPLALAGVRVGCILCRVRQRINAGVEDGFGGNSAHKARYASRFPILLACPVVFISST